MSNYSNLPPYPAPIHQLPHFMQELTQTVVSALDVDPSMALATLLSGMASAAHGTNVVERPDGGAEPLSLFSVIVAPPTAGKTRSHRLVHKVHLQEDLRRYGAALAREDADRPLRTRSDSRTASNRTRWVSLQNVTNRALVEAIRGIGESTSISSDEGQIVLSSDLFRRHLETLNTLYDGNKVMLNRAGGDCVVAADASLVALVMVQPDIFGDYCQRYGKLARGVGFFARTLFTIAASPQPFAQGATPEHNASLESYEATVKRLLKTQAARLVSGQKERNKIRFSTEACHLYHALAREHSQRTRNQFWSIQDAANRAMQNMIRLAAIMHVFSGETGPIPPQTLEASYEIVHWHLAQFAELFPPKPSPLPAPPKLTTQERAQQRLRQRVIEDRQAILRIIDELCRINCSSSAPKSEVQTLFREHAYDARFRAALLRLTNERMVVETLEGKQARLSIAPGGALHPPAQAWFSTRQYLSTHSGPGGHDRRCTAHRPVGY